MLSRTVWSGLGAQAWRAPLGLAAREVLFCFRGIGAESPVPGNTLDLERRVVDVGGCEAAIPERALLNAVSRVAWVHVPAPPRMGCDLGAPQVSVALSEKWV